MTTYNDRTADQEGRQIHPVLVNTAKDGSGTWYVPVVDSNGYLQVDVISQPAVSTGAAPDNCTVANTSTAALAANTSRKGAVFTNDSDEAIYLAFGNTAVGSKGIRLNATGGSYEINALNLYTGAVNAICASGSKVLCVQEFT